jgi:hypothetical protein
MWRKGNVFLVFFEVVVSGNFVNGICVYGWRIF